MDITQTGTERKPALGDKAGRFSTAIPWRRMARELLTKAENDTFSRVFCAKQGGDNQWWNQVSLALWCSEVASIIEGVTLPCLGGQVAHLLRDPDLGPGWYKPFAYHQKVSRSMDAWSRNVIAIGHSITVDEAGGRITRLGLCPVCGMRVDYVMSDVEAARWLVGVDQVEV